MAALGARIARRLVAGDIVALDGELGAGKTTLTRGLGEALGVRGPVTSPTFVLARTHPRPDGAPLVHVDAYRLSSAAELDDLDIDFAGSIVVVEWASGMLDGLAEAWLAVRIDRTRGGGLSTGRAGASAVSGAVAASASGAGPVAGAGPFPGETVEDRPEPRIVTITGHGERWSDLRGL
jgi:tRNA threonylcarbamoyl adenosine modification protein YjeE